MNRHRASLLRRMGFVLEATVVIPLGNLAALLPWKTGRTLASMIGLFIFRLNTSGRKHAHVNLDIIYGENALSEKEKDHIIKRLFMNIASSLFEYMKLKSITDSNYLNFVYIQNGEACDRALEEGKGVLAISAHMGNWEILGSVGAILWKNIAAVINRQLNPYTDKWLRKVRENRGRIKCLYHDARGLNYRIGFHLKQNGTIALLADQKDLSCTLIVPFFGMPSLTADGAAKLHLLYGSPIVICFAVKQTDGKYLLTYDGPYHFDRSGNLKKDCQVIMTWVNSKYEEMIRKHPDQWFSLLTPRWERNRPEDFKNRLWR